jgi:excisionase family DNA binding protein
MVLDEVVTDQQLAERLGCPVRDIKRAWRQGRLRGTKLSTGLRFREQAIRAWLEAEEERCHASNMDSLGLGASAGGQAGTSITTRSVTSESADVALALTIANELKKPLASSSGSVRALQSPARLSRRNAIS